MKDILNKKVKFREAFRPFAPACIYEFQNEYFDLDISAPYMLMVANVKENVKKYIPAVVHVDGTARVQSVSKELMPEFYALITEFYKITKIPMVINTSFNIKGEEIVETPEDAIKCFLKTEIDELYIGKFKVTKKLRSL